MYRARIFVAGLALGLLSSLAQAQQVVPTRGVDSRVDYPALKKIGPWDDRNYQLTLEDLQLLAPNEQEQKDPIPAFYRVLIRKESPGMRRTGPAQYGRAALNLFLARYGGYLVDGKVYRGTSYSHETGQFEVVLRDGLDRELAARAAEAADAIDGEARVTSPVGAAESAIAIHPTNTNLVIASTNGPAGGQKMHWSANGGSTWTQVSLPLGGTCCDPTVEWSSDGTKAYTVTLGGCGANLCNVWVYRSGDNGATWTDLQTITPGDPRREVTSAGNSDKEYLHVDRYSASPRKDNLYLCWDENNTMELSRSTDLANTWTAPQVISTGADDGIGCDLTTDKSGNLYYFWPAFNTQAIRMRKSTDGGATFGSTITVASTQGSFDFPIPSFENRHAFIYTAADVDLGNGPFANSIYVSWLDSSAPTTGNPNTNHSRIQVAYSRDGGATWTVRTPHPTADISTVDRFNPWLSVTGEGVVHVMFYDTQLDNTRAAADLYHSFSTDGGDTWSTPERLTTVSSPHIEDGFQWGDYNGMSASQGELLPIFTDNRNEGGGGTDSVDVYVAGFNSLMPLFADGFETGDLTAWALTVP
ncbi:MAG: sialidase family protein [Thermoanaerobaculia bacterium]